jgi:hypothetical protein
MPDEESNSNSECDCATVYNIHQRREAYRSLVSDAPSTVGSLEWTYFSRPVDHWNSQLIIGANQKLQVSTPGFI